MIFIWPIFFAAIFLSRALFALELEIASETSIEAVPGELIFVSALLKNPSDQEASSSPLYHLPPGWQVAFFSSEPLTVPPEESLLHLFSVKVPSAALAGQYSISLSFEGQKKTIQVTVKVFNAFNAYVDNADLNCQLVCENRGNAPLTLYINCESDPICFVEYPREPFTILPFDTVKIPCHIEPEALQDEEKQFVIFKCMQEGSEWPLFQIPLSFNINPQDKLDDDPFIRVPSTFRMMALGENSQVVGVLEVAGSGVIDPEKNRYLEYCIRVPTERKNVIYSVDQRLYLGLSEPGWDLNLGDTVYELSPLTQNFRYGRGGGFDIEKNHLAFGAHYTENPFNNDYNPRESCAFIEYAPLENWSFSSNYLHKTLERTPTSNILTFASEFEPMKNFVIDLEGGHNFLKESTNHDTRAYRAEARGRIFEDTWFDIEKIYAGAAFYGYYQAMNLFSSTLDMPITRPLRANFSYTSLTQNFASQDPNDPQTLSPRQKTGNMTLSYQFLSGAVLSFNGLLLRGKEIGITEDYNFYQKWAGASLFMAPYGYNFNANISIGQQKDYLTGRTSHGLQRYYTYLGKDLTDLCFLSCFYEGGHIDYYDVKPWKTTFGGACRYRYQSACWFELLAQKVNYKHDDYKLSQVSCNLHHRFPNYHSVDVSYQRFFYKSHYPSDTLFLVAYNIPFGLSIKEKVDRCDVTGSLIDSWSELPVPNALVNLNGRQTRTDEAGRFTFPRSEVGNQIIKTEILPAHLVQEEVLSNVVHLQKGRRNELMLSCVPAASIEGSLCLLEESLASPMPGVRITIDRDNGKEVYTCLTNQEGRFSFLRLRPGSWRVYISAEQLPRLHYLSMNDFILDLDPEDKMRVELKVLPEKREILPLD